MNPFRLSGRDGFKIGFAGLISPCTLFCISAAFWPGVSLMRAASYEAFSAVYIPNSLNACSLQDPVMSSTTVAQAQCLLFTNDSAVFGSANAFTGSNLFRVGVSAQVSPELGSLGGADSRDSVRAAALTDFTDTLRFDPRTLNLARGFGGVLLIAQMDGVITVDATDNGSVVADLAMIVTSGGNSGSCTKELVETGLASCGVTLAVGPSDQFQVRTTLQAIASGRNMFRGVADFQNTAEVLDVLPLDASGNPILGALVISESGGFYASFPIDTGVPGVPESNTIALLAAGLFCLIVARLHRGRIAERSN